MSIIYICILDLEATCFINNNYHEVIEFASVLYRWNINNKLLSKVSEFKEYCKPKNNPIISKFCLELTGITQEQINNGISFYKALNLHNIWLNNYVNNMEKLFIITCGDWDLKNMFKIEFKNYNIKHIPKQYLKFINIQYEFMNLYNTRFMGLNNMLKYLNLNFTGKQHSGIIDCKNTGNLLEKMIDQGYKINKKSIIYC